MDTTIDTPQQQPPPPPSYSIAPTNKLPKSSHFNTIETPFPIKSIPQILSLLSGPVPPTLQSNAQSQRDRHARVNIDGVFNGQSKGLEMWLTGNKEGEEEGGASRWRHPLMGSRVDVGRLLLRVKKRRRKVPRGMEEEEEEVVMGGGRMDLGKNRKGKGKERRDGIHERNFGNSTTKRKVEQSGIFKADIIGVVSRTVRFKAMADYQYTPNPNDLIPKLVQSLWAADAQAILDFKFSPLNETYYVPKDPTTTNSNTSTSKATTHIGDIANKTTSLQQPKEQHLRIWSDDNIMFKSVQNVLPPPIFSRQVTFHNFSYHANPATKLTTVKDPISGEEVTRLYNTMRGKATAMIAVRFDELGPLPTGPDDEVLKGVEYLDQELLELLKKKMEERPMWSRQALVSQFSPSQQKSLESKKAYYPISAWTYVDGPFRDTLVRFGYDPRAHPESYIYQRIYFRTYRPDDSGVRGVMRRMVDMEYESREGRGAKGKDSEQVRKRAAADGAGFKIDPNKGHIFDGQVLHRDVANYQLIDITDPLLYDLIHDPRARKDHVDSISGWFHQKQFDTIKAILRRKWLAMSEGGTCADEDCADLVKEFQDFESSKSPSRQVSRMTSVEVGNDEEGGPDEASTSAAGIQKKRFGRPKGGGGYVAGTVPTNTTVRPSLSRTERWKRKGTAFIPLEEAEQAARRLERAIEREQRQLRHATMRQALEDMERGDDEEVDDDEEFEGVGNEEAGGDGDD